MGRMIRPAATWGGKPRVCDRCGGWPAPGINDRERLCRVCAEAAKGERDA